MVNCWFGLVVWDWNRDTPKQQSLSMRRSNRNPNQQAPNQQLTISWNFHVADSTNTFSQLFFYTWFLFGSNKSTSRATPSRPKMEPISSTYRGYRYNPSQTQGKGLFFEGYNWSIYGTGAHGAHLVHKIWTWYTIKNWGGHPCAVVVCLSRTQGVFVECSSSSFHERNFLHLPEGFEKLILEFKICGTKHWNLKQTGSPLKIGLLPSFHRLQALIFNSKFAVSGRVMKLGTYFFVWRSIVEGRTNNTLPK